MADSRTAHKSLWQKALSSTNSRTDGQTSLRVGQYASDRAMFRENKSSSFHKIAADMLEKKKRLEKEKEVKEKTEELDRLKDKYTKEQDEKQKLQKELEDLSNRQFDSNKKLARSQEVVEKLRADNMKKSEQIEKLERNISYMEDRMRNLEIRASEVEIAELTLESTRRNLESVQQEVKTKERELARIQEKHDETCKHLKNSNARTEELEKKIEDLKLQVRYELMKNENIEKSLEMIPNLKSDLEESDKKIADLQKDLEERSALLNAFRKTSREYKQRLRDLERQEKESQIIREELELARNEIITLKKLMAGKDALLQQKCHLLDQAKLTVDTLRTSSSSSDAEKVDLKKIRHVLEQLKQFYGQTVQNDNIGGKSKIKSAAHSRSRSAKGDRKISIDHHPYSIENGYNKENSNESQGKGVFHGEKNGKSPCILLNRFPSKAGKVDSPKRNHERNICTFGGAVQRSQSFHHGGPTGDVRGFRSQSKGASTCDDSAKGRRPLTSSTLSRKSMNVHTSGLESSTGNVYMSESSQNVGSKYRPSLDYPLGVSTDDELRTGDTSSPRFRSASPRGLLSTHSGFTLPWDFGPKKGDQFKGEDNIVILGLHGGFAGIKDSPLTEEQVAKLSYLSTSKKDKILSDIIQTGTRVSITVTPRPPRYGRKKPTPITYMGIVKYKGVLDAEQYDTRIYVGVKLDAPIGDSDGTFRGKRYMYTSPDHSKFFKIGDIDSILQVQSGLYIPTSKLILCYQEVSQHDQLQNQDTSGVTAGHVYHSNGHALQAVV